MTDKIGQDDMKKSGEKNGGGREDGATPVQNRLDHLATLPIQDEKKLETLLTGYQERLTRIQHAYLFKNERAVIVFEGVDAAGKGGTIRRIAWALDPRSLHVWPIGSPNEIERRQHYLQRFWQRLPEKGQFAVFDRSWYGRVLVERVEGFASRRNGGALMAKSMNSSGN
jgi:polyphosphate kinase 2 (PPK2 family)